MNDSLNISAELERSFTEYDCDDEIIVYESQRDQQCTNPLIRMVNAVLLDRAKYNKSYTAASEYANNISSVPGAKLKLPITKKALKREANLKYRYVFCELRFLRVVTFFASRVRLCIWKEIHVKNVENVQRIRKTITLFIYLCCNKSSICWTNIQTL